MNRAKSFDAVKMMRRIRDQLSREIEGMTPQEEIEYFRRKALQSTRRSKKGRAALETKRPKSS